MYACKILCAAGEIKARGEDVALIYKLAKLNTEELRKEVGWTQERASTQLGIPIRTIQGWAKRRLAPVYVVELIAYAIFTELRQGETNGI